MASNWHTVSVDIPQPLRDLAEGLDSLLDALLTILDIALEVLEIVKTFMVGLLDPLAAIIAAILNEIESLIQDIRQIGVYISGDLEVEYPFDTLRGGFAAYERRMVGRLVDRSDPTRPAFSSASEVLAVFLYVSVDVDAIESAVEFIDRVKAFFGLRRRPRTYTQPVGLEVTYGAPGTSIAFFGPVGEVEAPTVANVRWSMAPPTNAGSVAWPLPAPPGFLVEVSTVRDGLTLAWEAPAAPAAPDASGQQDRVFGLVSDPDGRPFRLYGGSDMLDTGDLAWTATGDTYSSPAVADDGTLKPGGIRLMAYKDSTDNVPIPVDALRRVDGRHVLQRTFFVDMSSKLLGPIGPGQPFSVRLNHEDMPYDATFVDAGQGKVRVVLADEPARTVYVRISAVTAAITGTGNPAGPSAPLWKLSQAAVTAGQRSSVRLEYDGGTGGDRGDPSSPLTLAFPGTSTQAYLDAVTAALVILVLARADLVPSLDSVGATNQNAAEAQLAAVQAAIDEAILNTAGLDAEAQTALLDSLRAQLPAAEAAVGDATPSFAMDVGGVETGLEDLGRYLVPQIVGPFAARFFKKGDIRPADFRRRLLAQCRALTNDLFARTGPLPTAVESFVVDKSRVNGVPLSEVTWADLVPGLGLTAGITILASLDPTLAAGRDPSEGVALNPVSTGVAQDVAEQLLKLGYSSVDRPPGFLESIDSTGAMGDGSADYSPVLYRQTAVSTDMVFCRNAFLDNPEVLSAASAVLNVASSPLAYTRPPGDGAWTAIRLFPQGIPPIDAFLSEIEGFIAAVLDGIRPITEMIVQYIDFVEARILELEALVRRIEALLDSILAIKVPSAAGLVVAGQGTDGILQGLVTATDKPIDSASAYGMGIVLVAGGLPTAVAELIQLLFPEG